MLTEFQRFFDVLKINLKTKNKLNIKIKIKIPQNCFSMDHFGDFNSYDI